MEGQVDETLRLDQIPVLYVRGTNYECGYAIGRQFRSMIEDLLKKWDYLNEVLVPAYMTTDGREIYDRSLSLCTQKFPQYVEELQGIADGSKASFSKLFLLHIDTLIVRPVDEKGNVKADLGNTGCTTVMSNSDYGAILGHTEDALPEFLNNVYIVSAEILDENGVKLEKFTTLTYAGHLPGYTMGFNESGLVYTINSIFPSKTLPFRTPKMFLTRAILGASNFVRVLDILRDAGTGSADGFSLNITFANQEGAPVMHNVEVGPSVSEKSESELSVLNLTHGDSHAHCNKYLRLDIPQSLEIALDSSNHRHKAIEQHPKPACVQDLKEILSDQGDSKYPVFRCGLRKPDYVKTVAVGIFDIPGRIWSIYMRPPNGSDPVAELQMKF